MTRRLLAALALTAVTLVAWADTAAAMSRSWV